MSMNIQKLCGWAGETEARKAMEQLGDQFPRFQIVGSTESKAGGTYRLWDFTRKVLGHDTPNYAQKTGDCVSFGAKNAIEYLACIEIVRGDQESFHPLFPPYLYYTGRVLIGNNQLRGRAGSVGSWMAKAVEKYGTIPAELDGVPTYSGSLADEWGDGRGECQRWVDVGDDHLIQTTSPIRNWSELVDAIGNGYPVTIASDLGFTMKPGRDGYHEQTDTWHHQMMIHGICDGAEPWWSPLNSWGNVHGTVLDPETGEPWPAGSLKCRPEVLDRAFSRGELFAYSQFQGFPEQRLRWNFV